MGTTTLLTFEQFERLPAEPGKRELLRGELIELPPAKRKHNLIAEGLYLALIYAVAALRREQPQARLGEPHIGMGYRVTREPDSWLIPDASLSHPGQPGEDYFEGAPLLAIEVVSASNTAESIESKRRLYLENSGVEVWEVYPKAESVWVFRTGYAEPFTGELRSEIVPGLRIDLNQIFRPA